MIYQAIKLLFAILLVLVFSNTAFAKINVFACVPEWAALTQELGGDAVKVFSATTARQDPHRIQARPSLIARVRNADLLVCTGAELEVGWLPLLLRKSGNGNILHGQVGYFMAAEQVSLLEKPQVLDRSLGHIHAAGNPHIHLDPHRILLIAAALSKRLTQLDAKNSVLYQKNLHDFTQRWQQSITQWEQRAQSLRGKRIVVSHNSWVYLEQWLGLQRVATLEPKPGVPPSSAHLGRVLNTLKKEPAVMILYASSQSNKSAHWLSKKTGITAVSLAFSPSENETLTQWFEQIVNQLLESK